MRLGACAIFRRGCVRCLLRAGGIAWCLAGSLVALGLLRLRSRLQSLHDRCINRARGRWVIRRLRMLHRGRVPWRLRVHGRRARIGRLLRRCRE